jgi:formylglycine-generating enzyme required for sulfatase activity
MVMDFETGEPLEGWLQGLGRPPTQAELDRIAAPLLHALEMMHAESFLHRDIAPDNIIIRSDGTPVLLDFGAARRAVAEMSRTITGIVKAGYSPHEQYATDGRLQGPWSDIYAFGATLYRAVTGKPPEEATLRMTDDRVLPAAVAAIGDYRPGFLNAIDACLKVRPDERPQSVAQVRPMLLGQETRRTPDTLRIVETHKIEQEQSKPAGVRRRWITAAAVLALLAGSYGGFEYARRPADREAKMQTETANKTAEKVRAPAPLPPPAVGSPSLTRCDGDETEVGGEKRCLKAKDTFRDCPDCPEMVVVPAGIFTMGSPANEPQRNNGEAQVRITISAPFAAGKYAVTFDEWDACVADSGCNGYKPGDEGWGRGKHPVIYVNWDDANSYVAWLSRKTGKIYRLLSDTEREYVTRAESTTPFWWGASITPKQANYNGNFTYEGGGSKDEFIGRTLPVDSFEPNPWGLYNVHGNVYEWTEDCWNDSNAGNPGDGRARTTGDCSRRVVRGGSWFNYPQVLRSANGDGWHADYRSDNLGFRLARTLLADAQPTPSPEKDAEARKKKTEEEPRTKALLPPPVAPSPAGCDGVETQVGSERRCLKPKDTFKECPNCPEMVVVPAGHFAMGSPAGEGGHVNDEGPKHEVTIAKPFAVSHFAITRSEFAAFVRETNHATGDKCWIFNGEKWEERSGRSFRNPGFAQDDRHPVVCVNWVDAKAYAAWLSKRTGRSYRLLSEAEREYVTRAGTTTPFWWGSSITPKQANYDGSAEPYEGGGSKGEDRLRTMPVDSFEPNPWGLYNAHGNVSEWTEDCYHDDYQGAPTDGSAWTTACVESSFRVLRGGSWVDGPTSLRSANRSRWYAKYRNIRNNNNGFRLARTLGP